MVERGHRQHGQFQPDPRVGPQASLDRLSSGIAGYGVPAGVVLEQTAVRDILLVGTGVAGPGGRDGHRRRVGHIARDHRDRFRRSDGILFRSADMTSYPKPRRSNTPNAKFSMTTSDMPIRSLASRVPSGFERFSAAYTLD